MAYENITVQREENVAVVTVNRPGVLNALNRATIGELEAAVDELAADDAVRAIIFTGAGERAFVAGADINELRDLPSAAAAAILARRGQALFSKIEALPKPTIMAINGFALGGGCELAMAGDIRIASESARFGQPEINLGIIPGYGGTQRLPRLVGKGMAKLLVLSGDIIDASEALRIGLVDRVVPSAQLMNAARDLAKKLARKAPMALALAKKCIDDGIEMPLSQGLAFEASQFAVVRSSQDSAEGLSAFLEKRPPEFKGR